MPVLLIITAASMAAAGLGMTVKAASDHVNAKTLSVNSTERIEKAALRLDDLRKKCDVALNDLGEEKVFVLNGSIRAFVNNFSQLKNVDFVESAGLLELHKLHIDQKEFDELGEMSKFSYSLTQGAATGAMSGALAAFGAYSAATTFASASTGTAIATLSGAAAKSATLAWFGGGALSAGGAGVAGGTAVLGGIVAGPAFLVMGIILGAKAGKNLENAKANAAEAGEICEQLENGALQCIAIRRRTTMFYTLLARLDAYLLPLVYSMEHIIATEGTNYSQYLPESKKVIAAAASAAVSVKAILDTPILSDDGSLTRVSEKAADSLIKEMDEKETAALKTATA